MVVVLLVIFDSCADCLLSMGVAATSMIAVLLSATNACNVVRSILMVLAFGMEDWSSSAVGMCLVKICVGLDRAAKASRSVREEISHLRTV